MYVFYLKTCKSDFGQSLGLHGTKEYSSMQF